MAEDHKYQTTDPAEVTNSGGNNARLFREEVKERHTSHWDLDYISKSELERLMTKNKP